MNPNCLYTSPPKKKIGQNAKSVAIKSSRPCQGIILPGNHTKTKNNRLEIIVRVKRTSLLRQSVNYKQISLIKFVPDPAVTAQRDVDPLTRGQCFD
jgi:hypothetical protein